MKVRIDEYISAVDCAALQSEFDLADANSDATLNRTGHSNVALMTYIDDGMRSIGCFG